MQTRQSTKRKTENIQFAFGQINIPNNKRVKEYVNVKQLQLNAACANNDLILVGCIFADPDVDINGPGIRMQTPLYVASENGHVDTVEWLLESGANVDQADEQQCTPLYIACLHGHDAVISKLIECGADVNKPDQDGWTPLHTTCCNGHTDIVRTLLENDANINQPNNDNNPPMYTCLHSNLQDNKKIEVIKLLLEHDAEIIEIE